MSQEWDDDDVWDDPEPIIETIIREIKIDNINACDIQVFEKGLITCIEQKLEKLNIIANQIVRLDIRIDQQSDPRADKRGHYVEQNRFYRAPF